MDSHLCMRPYRMMVGMRLLGVCLLLLLLLSVSEAHLNPAAHTNQKEQTPPTHTTTDTQAHTHATSPAPSPSPSAPSSIPPSHSPPSSSPSSSSSASSSVEVAVGQSPSELAAIAQVEAQLEREQKQRDSIARAQQQQQQKQQQRDHQQSVVDVAAGLRDLEEAGAAIKQVMLSAVKMALEQNQNDGVDAARERQRITERLKDLQLDDDEDVKSSKLGQAMAEMLNAVAAQVKLKENQQNVNHRTQNTNQKSQQRPPTPSSTPSPPSNADPSQPAADGRLAELMAKIHRDRDELVRATKQNGVGGSGKPAPAPSSPTVESYEAQQSAAAAEAKRLAELIALGERQREEMAQRHAETARLIRLEDDARRQAEIAKTSPIMNKPPTTTTTTTTPSPSPASSTPSTAATTPLSSSSDLSADIAAALKKQSEQDSRDRKYVIGLLSAMPTIPSASNVDVGARTVVMTAKSGTKFRCTIPSPNAPEGNILESKLNSNTVNNAATTGKSPQTSVKDTTLPASTSSSSVEDGGVKSSSSSSSSPPLDPIAAAKAQRSLEEKGIPALIRRNLGGGCFTKQIDYWTYEVCPFRKIRQYHRDIDSQVIGMEFSLGTHIPAGDAVQQIPLAGHHVAGSLPLSRQAMSYTQVFEGGSGNRQSRVTFTCNPEPQVTTNSNTAHILVTMKEPKQHHYEFEIKTTLMCRDAQGYVAGIGAPPSSEKKSTPKTTSPSSSTGSTSSSSPDHVDIETGRLKSGPSSYGATSGSSSTSHTGGDSSNTGVPHVLDLLEPMGQQCLYLNNGWWTYKLCYLKEITQFHREQVILPMSPNGATTAGGDPKAAGGGTNMAQVKTGARSAAEAAANLAEAAAAGVTMAIQTKLVTTAEFVLGIIPSTESFEKIEHDSRIVKGDSWESTYVSQHYHSGTLCDLNNRPRLTETRIYCDLHETGSVLKSVVESATCEYIVVIHTPLICTHPLFKPNIPKVMEIQCEPLTPIVQITTTPTTPTNPRP